MKRNLELIFMFVTAVATSVAAYATYHIYYATYDLYLQQVEQPTTAIQVYKIQGTQEFTYSSGVADLILKKLSSDDASSEYDLPLKISNSSKKDVDGIDVILTVENGELVIPTDWKSGKYGDNLRHFKSVESLHPMSWQTLPSIKLRVKNDIHEVTLKWIILAKHAIPTSGEIILRV